MKNLKSYREYLEYVYTNEFSIGNMLPQVPLNEKSNTEKPNKVIKNDKGQIVPTVCPKCGSNEKCKRFFGVVPLDKINEEDTNTNLYFVTKSDMKSKTTLEPRIPQNFLTDNGFEDNKIKRVCFSTSINGAVPFKESVELNDTIPPTSFISKCKMTKSFRKFSPDFYGARHDWYYNGDWVGGCIIVYNNTHEKKRIHDKLYNTDSIYFYPGIWIDDLYVDEKYRGRGLARDICKLCISEYGVDHIACVRGNSVISLYKSLGFEVYKCEQDDLNYIYYMKMNGNVNESFETFVTTNPFENTIHLYHASHNQERLRTIKPLSKNFGSRVSSMRLSSFWAVDKNISLIMAIVKLIGSCGYDAQCLSKSRFAILNCDESEYDNIMSSLKDKVIWLYEKTMPKKYVKIGHDNIMEEYSIDIPVSPDKSTCYTFNDYKEFITRDKLVFFTTEFLQSKGKEWYKDFINNEMKIIRKENGRFLGNLMFKNYSTKSMMNKDFKSLNSNVNESVFMNKDDYYFDFDKFESGESNILFVTGLTGSGKSTIGRSFASKYHAEYVELDLMDPCSNLCSQSLDEIKKDKSNKVIYEYLSSHKSVYERLKSGKMRNDEIFLNNVRFISFVRSYANKHKDTKFIVEGLQLYEYCTFRKTIIKPMVIKGTSVLTSFIRKAKREKWSTKDIIKYAPGTVKRMIKDDKVLLQLINACKTDDVINESVSSITSKSAKGPDDALAKDIRAVIKSLSSDDYKSFDYKSKKMYYQSVYYDGDNPIGFVFTRSFDEEGRHSLTISVALNPDYRGKGLALKMVREVLNTIKQDKSIYQIYWGADMDNKGSIELAKRAGFKHNYDYRDSTFYTKVVNDTKTVNESVKRSELPDDVFGIPQERKYPMQDKQHVKAAIKFFNYVEPKYEEQLANRIIENMKIYNIDVSSIGDKNRLKKYIIEGSRYDMTHSLVKDLEFLYFESGDPDIPDLIEPIVKQLESKGYQVKYASPGHTNTRFDNDQNKDGVINAKMRSTARIIFSRDYRFKTTPQGWEWKVLENGSKALYVKPYTYNEKMGSKEEAFKKWQTFYIDNMKSWVTDLPKAGSDAKSKPDVNF